VLRLLDIGVTHHTANVLDAAALGEHVGGEGVAKVGYFGMPWDIYGAFMMFQNVFSGTNTHFSDLFFISRNHKEIMCLAKERESDDSLLSGAYEKLPNMDNRLIFC